MTPSPTARMPDLAELRRLLDNAAGEALLPPGWRELVGYLPALLEREEKLTEALEIIATDGGSSPIAIHRRDIARTALKAARALLSPSEGTRNG